MRRLLIAAPWAIFLGLCTSLTAQDNMSPVLGTGKPEVVKDLVKGSIHHRAHGKDIEWERTTGKVQVINPSTIRFADGTVVKLAHTPELNETFKKEATDFLRKLVDDHPVTSFGYVGDTNLEHAMILHGWGLAGHSSLHAAEIIARENKRGFWRDADVAGLAPEKNTDEKPIVIKDRVKGSINHDKGKREWQRIAGRAQVIDAHTLEFADGTRILLHVIARTWTRRG